MQTHPVNNIQDPKKYQTDSINHTIVTIITVKYRSVNTSFIVLYDIPTPW